MGLLLYDNSQKTELCSQNSDTLNDKTGVQLPQRFKTAGSFPNKWT